jgi:hypothetical protein
MAAFEQPSPEQLRKQREDYQRWAANLRPGKSLPPGPRGTAPGLNRRAKLYASTVCTPPSTEPGSEACACLDRNRPSMAA